MSDKAKYHIPASAIVDFMLIIYTVDHTSDESINGPEGRNLLFALTAFTVAAVHAPPKAQSKKSKVL